MVDYTAGTLPSQMPGCLHYCERCWLRLCGWQFVGICGAVPYYCSYEKLWQGVQEILLGGVFCSVFVRVLGWGLPIKIVAAGGGFWICRGGISERGRKMNTEKRTRIGPVCKFGPGGDFVSVWPRQLKPLFRRSQSRLVRLLGSMGGTIAELFDSEFSTVQIESAGAEGGGGVSSEPMLFADDWRAGRQIRHKPKHRIRAYRRAAKKRAAVEFSGQGTLFEADGKSTKTA